MFRFGWRVFGHIGVVSWLLVNPAKAQVRSSNGLVNGPEIADFLRSEGYQGELIADLGGDPAIKSSAGGTKFVIFFGGCDKLPVRSCSIMQFRATFQNDKNYAPTDMNHCNSVRFIGRAWLGPDDSVNIGYSIPVFHVDQAFLANALDMWASISAGYQQCLTDQRK